MAIVDAHNEEIKEENFTEIEYKKDQKNHIAIKLITTRLSSSDRRKVFACRTAKEKWDELEKIYREPDVVIAREERFTKNLILTIGIRASCSFWGSNLLKA